MLYFSLILILVQTIKALSCSKYYDYTADTVRCTATCPANSKLVTNKCLNNNQYLIEQQVHYCYRGWVDSQNSICCPQSYYVSINKNLSTCLKCSTRVYLKGMLCCPASQYADLTNQNRPICTSLGTGTCSGITIKNLFQVCCPSGLFYSLQQQMCVNPSSYNCNNAQRVCCRQGYKLDSSNSQLICVPTCGWNDKNNFICRKKQCNNYGQLLEASMTLYNLQNWSKLSFTSICSYGLNTNGSPVNDPALCMKRFLNRGWAVCCQTGEIYSIKNNQCSLSCDGIILFQFFCIQQGSILNLQAANGQPVQSPSSSLCNNKRVSNLYPVCCPSGFYINSTNGCELCNGRVFTSTTNQICCGYNQNYNSATDRCQQCNGIVNRQGTLCCLDGQYFSYSTSGNATCLDSCDEGKIYKTDYCCDSLTNSCQDSGYQPTLCSPSYFIEGACQACPTFCTLSTQVAQICAIGIIDQCQKICQQGTIYSTEIQQCLACDPSCQDCSQPFDPQYCINCKQGYVYSQGQCNRCAPQCFTCTIGINTCTSCSQNSSRPVLINGRCASICQVKQYYQIQTASCSQCASNCIQCTGSSQFQCSKCPHSKILNAGICSQCSIGCITCFFTSSQCFKCQNNYVLDKNNQCIASCQPGYFRYYEPSLGHIICHVCHPSCASCINQAQNCVSCSNSSQFLNGQIGLNICTACNYPCLTCNSTSTCLSCQSGFYFQNSTCLICDPTCQTCSSQSNTACLSCFGTSQLISGRCVGCSSSCSKCDASQNCEVCQPQLYIYHGNCVQECPQRSYESQKSCRDCLINCSICVDNKTCTSCSSSHPIFFDNSCLKNCPQGYKLQNGICIVNNNNNNNTDNNNKTDNNTNNKKLIKIISQQIKISSQGSSMIVKTTLQNLNQNSSLSFYLYNTKTTQKIKLKSVEMESTQAHLLSSSNKINLTYNVSLPSDGASIRDSILITAVDNNFNSSTYYNTKSIWTFIIYDYTTNPLMGLQYVGLSFTILILIYALISKLKGHFIAEQANTIILHMLNFIQVVYLFKYTQLQTQGMYHFLNGFGFMHLLMFPNFFYNSIPTGYVQYPAQKSLIPDGNFIRNAGSSISFMLISLVIMLVAFIVSYVLYRVKDLFEMPQIRKITRIGILAIQITFLNIVFTALNYLIQPFVTTDAGFTNSSRVAAIIMFIIIFIAMVGIFFHFYKTYNSDVLQHYYTLREGCHYIIIVCQAFIFTFAIGKPLVCLFLIPLQIIWFTFNYILYKYGQGDKITQHVKFIVSTVCVIIAYLFLSLSGQINWILIVVIVSIVVVILIVYSSYQIIGLYHALIFRNQVKCEQVMQIKQTKGQGTDKQIAYKI